MNTDYESEPPVSCYHCHEHPPLHGSVFCHVCQPDRTGQPRRILAERIKPRHGLFKRLRRALAWITCPWVRVLELEVELKKTQAESADFEQSNLAIRKKCADLRAQLNASTEVFDALHKEHDLALAAHRKVAAERDEMEQRMRAFICGYCGKPFAIATSQTPTPDELGGLVEMFKLHDSSCPCNPMVQKIEALQARLTGWLNAWRIYRQTEANSKERGVAFSAMEAEWRASTDEP